MSKPKIGKNTGDSGVTLESLLGAVRAQKESFQEVKLTLATPSNPLDESITQLGNDPWVLSSDPSAEEEIAREDEELGDELLHTLEENTRFLEEQAFKIEADRYFNDKVQEQELLIAKAHETHAMIPMGARSAITRADFRESVKTATDMIETLEAQRTNLSGCLSLFLELLKRVKKHPLHLTPVIDPAALEFVPSELKGLFPGAESGEEKSPLVDNPANVDSE